MTRRTERPLPLAVWLLGLAVIGVLVLVAFRQWPWSVFDRDQQRNLVVGIAHLDLRYAFDDWFQTSGPGFGLYAQPVYLAAHPFVTQLQAYQLAGASTVVPLGAAAIAALRAVGVARRSARELFLTAMVVLSVPTLACFSEAWHPSDVLATALCLAAFATRTRGHRTATALILGAALATRQWALIPLAITVVLDDEEHRLRVLLTACATAAVLVLPFFVAGPKHVLEALGADDVARTDVGAVGLLPLGPALRLIVSRYIPLALTAAVCAWCYRRRLRWDPELALGAMAVTLLARAAIDPALAAYYLAPGAACFTIMWRRSWAAPTAAYVAGWLFWWRLDVLQDHPGTAELTADPSTWFHFGRFLTLASTAVLVGFIVAAWLRTRARGTELAGTDTSGSSTPPLPEPVAPV